MRKASYSVVVRGSSFNSWGPTSDKVLSRHTSEQSARTAFRKVSGPAQLLGPDGKVIDSQVA